MIGRNGTQRGTPGCRRFWSRKNPPAVVVLGRGGVFSLVKHEVCFFDPFCLTFVDAHTVIFDQGLVPPVNQCLLGQEHCGRVTQDRYFPRRQKLLKSQANS